MENAKSTDKCIDFINVFKGFIGSNYLSMPFAFAQSGLIFGILMLLIIGGLADHCCHKIVKCKRMIITRLLSEFRTKYNNGTLPDDAAKMFQSGKLEHYWETMMTLSHIAKYVFGKKAQWLVSICLFILQFGFCTGYFVFIGNTLQELLYHESSNQTREVNVTKIDRTEYKIPLTYLVMVSTPVFVVLAMLRTIRNIGWISAFAIATVAFGYCSILGIILDGFYITSEFSYIKLLTLPMVFGLLTSNFEAIGTIIPIESSMIGNRDNFPKYLHISLSLVMVILGSFGILGYLLYGETTQQIFPQNLQYSLYISIVNCTLIVGAICTYPLQMFPVIEIAEFLIFRKASTELSNDPDEFVSELENNATNVGDIKTVEIFSYSEPSINKEIHNGDVFNNGFIYSDGEKIVQNSKTIIITNDRGLNKREERMIRIINGTKITVGAWKRNAVRTILVLLQMGLAVVMKDNYAYLISFVGAIGGSFLVYILPSAIHYKLTGQSGERQYCGCADICIIVFGILGTIVSFVVSVINLIHQ